MSGHVERIASEIRSTVEEAGSVYADEVVRWLRRFGSGAQVGVASRLARDRKWVVVGRDGGRVTWSAPGQEDT